MSFRQDDYLPSVLGGYQQLPFQQQADLATVTFQNEILAFQVYATNGLAGRIVDMPADDCTARGVEIDGDDNGTLLAEFARLNVLYHVSDAVRWARLVGGGAMVLIAADGALLPDPLNLATLDQIAEIRTFDATQFSIAARYDNPALPNYGQPSVYQLQSGVSGQSFRVHESRVIPISGAPLPARLQRSRNVPWRGRSAIDGCLDQITSYDNCLRWTDRFMERKQQAVYAMKGLADRMAGGIDPLTNRTATQDIQDRVTATDATRGVLNTVVVDADDKYEMRDLSLSGVKDVINEKQIALSAYTGIVATILFGRSPAGQNATGDADKAAYQAFIDQIQRGDVIQPLNRLVTILLAQRSMRGAGVDAEWSIEFNPLWMPSDQEAAATRLANANADNYDAQTAVAYEGIGAVSPDTIAKNLGEQGKYGLTAATAIGAMPDEPEPEPVVEPEQANGQG